MELSIHAHRGSEVSFIIAGVSSPEQSMMFCSLRLVSLPLAKAQAPSRAPTALKA